MATCKDCLHYDLCKSAIMDSAIIKRLNGFIKLDEAKEQVIKEYYESCNHFKDRSRFVELPCKVGDTVYLLHNVYNNILAYSVSKILINSGEPIIEIVEAERRIHFLHLPARELNKSLFFTKEQAEQALKERESK